MENAVMNQSMVTVAEWQTQKKAEENNKELEKFCKTNKQSNNIWRNYYNEIKISDFLS